MRGGLLLLIASVALQPTGTRAQVIPAPGPVQPGLPGERNVDSQGGPGETEGAPGNSSSTAEKPAGPQLPDLPVWSPSDFEKIRKGELVAGQDFFAPAPVDPNAKIEPLPRPRIPEPPVVVPVPEVDETVIPTEYLTEYFREVEQTPEGAPIFLNDPQELLSQQEFRDRESFLRYHSSDSDIDMFVYLFDERQELPGGTNVATVYRDLFSERGSAAVVFYYLGAPERSQVHLSSDIQAVISQDEQDRALRAAIQEGFEKSDAAYQLDNFLVEFSIRLYWIERELKTAAGSTIAGLAQEDASRSAVEVTVSAPDNSPWRIGPILQLTLLVVLLGGATLLGWLLLERRRYRFPEVECGPLLGAPHAAGVGAVISFSDSNLPPSRQRDQVPDYLQRM